MSSILILFSSYRHSLVKMLDGSELDGPPPLRRASTVETHSPPHPPHHTHSPGAGTMGGSKLMRRASLDDLEQESCQLTPKIDHRIVVINTDEVKSIKKKTNNTKIPFLISFRNARSC